VPRNRSDDDVLFDSEDDRSDDKAIDEYLDSGYNNDGTDVTITKDIDKCYTTEIDESKKPLWQNLDAAKPSKFKEAK
jgi:hypothetical protein